MAETLKTWWRRTCPRRMSAATADSSAPAAAHPRRPAVSPKMGRRRCAWTSAPTRRTADDADVTASLRGAATAVRSACAGAAISFKDALEIAGTFVVLPLLQARITAPTLNVTQVIVELADNRVTRWQPTAATAANAAAGNLGISVLARRSRRAAVQMSGTPSASTPRRTHCIAARATTSASWASVAWTVPARSVRPPAKSPVYQGSSVAAALAACDFSASTACAPKVNSGKRTIPSSGSRRQRTGVRRLAQER
jgi:hypothetical protein